ncbi:DUF445 domain-containing protein [Paenibacillus montaniterrae]|uniref:DUF445 domain-containing protein n=1 Tax=Paenibacillus montaniterrae TaxID=429341 RepID=A0A920CZA7_9BACL|nr:DUF445 domain-containing protein [Paenibacillus montaniterrae]GIP16824.1 DUF445 domain-containing protein [Paenibacillus montaniterrae]
MTMRKYANLSLLLLALLFVAALALYWYFDQPWWAKAMLFIAEAGMVGALADWFAVTALFRHPLGMRWIPHTAIVPRNRDKLIDGVVNLVEEQLLNKAMIEEQLQKVNFTALLIKLLEQKWNAKFSEQLLRNLLPLLLKNVQADRAAQSIEQSLKQTAQQKRLAPYLSKGLAYLLEKGYDQQLLDYIINAAQKRVLHSDVKPAIKALLESEKDKMLDGDGGGWLAKALFSFAQAADAVNFDDAADVLYRDLLLLLAQLKDHDHELRLLLQRQLYELVRLLEKEEVIDALEQWKQQLLQKLSISPTIQQLLQGLLEQLGQDPAEKDADASILQKWLARFIHQYWQWLKEDEASQQLVEQKLKSFLHHLIEQEHVVIGKVVRSTLNTFSEERLVEFIESKVDIDLQRIRVNGALIGAVVGAILYALFYGIYEPLLANLT